MHARRVLAVQVDFDIVHRILEKGAKRESFRLILNAIQLSRGKFLNGEREFTFQICGRLSSQRSKGIIIDAVISSFEAHTAKPYLKPDSSFFPELNSAQIYEFRVGGRCGCSAACLPRGRYFAARTTSHTALEDASTGEVFTLLRGHDGSVRCIGLVGESKKIVAAMANSPFKGMGDVGLTHHDFRRAQWRWFLCCRG